jgi:hypothetical protein
MKMLARWIKSFAVASTTASALACAHPAAVPVTVIVDGAAAEVQQVRARLAPAAVAELTLRQATIAPPPDLELGAAQVAAAFGEFVAGDGSRCRELLAGVDLARLLAHQQRAVVARALLLDARCAEGLGNSAVADARFEEFAGYELELAEAGAVLSPTLRSRFDRALAKVGGAPRARVAVNGAPGGRVLIDGRAAVCAVPCVPSVSSGTHVIAVEAEGYALGWRQLMVSGAAAVPTVAITAATASAAEATAQWHARVGKGFAPDDASSLALLHLMAGDDRVIYLRVSPPTLASTAPVAAVAAPTLVGAMTLRRDREIAVAARGRQLGLAAAPALVRQLAIDAKVLSAPRPRWFWPVLFGSVVASAAITAALVYEPSTRTSVGF